MTTAAREKEKGEMVCTKPFPSMPVMFWNDPDGQKYHNAYFARFDNIWCHGDFAESPPMAGSSSMAVPMQR